MGNKWPQTTEQSLWHSWYRNHCTHDILCLIGTSLFRRGNGLYIPLNGKARLSGFQTWAFFFFNLSASFFLVLFCETDLFPVAQPSNLAILLLQFLRDGITGMYHRSQLSRCCLHSLRNLAFHHVTTDSGTWTCWAITHHWEATQSF